MSSVDKDVLSAEKAILLNSLRVVSRLYSVEDIAPIERLIFKSAILCSVLFCFTKQREKNTSFNNSYKQFYSWVLYIYISVSGIVTGGGM